MWAQPSSKANREANEDSETIPNVVTHDISTNRNPLKSKHADSIGRLSSLSDPSSDISRYEANDLEGFQILEEFMTLDLSMSEIISLFRETAPSNPVTDYLLRPWRKVRSIPEIHDGEHAGLRRVFLQEDTRVLKLDFALRKMNAFVNDVLFDGQMFATWGIRDRSQDSHLNDVITDRVYKLFDDGPEFADFRETVIQFGNLWMQLELSADSFYFGNENEESLYNTYSARRLREMGAWAEIFDGATGASLTHELRAPSYLTENISQELDNMATKISTFCRRRQNTLSINVTESIRNLFITDVTAPTVAFIGGLLGLALLAIVVLSIIQVVAASPSDALGIVIIIVAVITLIVVAILLYSYYLVASQLKIEHKYHLPARHSLSCDKQWQQLAKRLTAGQTVKKDLVTTFAGWKMIKTEIVPDLRDQFEASLLLEARWRKGLGAPRILCDVSLEHSKSFLQWTSLPVGIKTALTGDIVSSFRAETSQRTGVTGGGGKDDDSESSYMDELNQMQESAQQEEAENEKHIYSAPSTMLPNNQLPDHVKVPLVDNEFAFIPTKTLQRDIIIIGVKSDKIFMWNAAAEDATGFTSAEAIGRKSNLVMDSQSVRNLSALLKQKKLYEYRPFSLCSRKGTGVVTIRARLATCNVARNVEDIAASDRRMILIGTAVEQTDWYPFNYIYRLYMSVLQQQFGTLIDNVPSALKDLCEVMECTQLRSRAAHTQQWTPVLNKEVKAAIGMASRGMASVILDSSVDEKFFCDRAELINATQELIRMAAIAAESLQMPMGAKPIVVSITQRSYNESCCLQVRVELRPEFSVASEAQSMDSKRGPTAPFRVDRKRGNFLKLSEGLILITQTKDESEVNFFGQNSASLYFPISKYKLQIAPEIGNVQEDGVTFDFRIYTSDALLRTYLQRELQQRQHNVSICANVEEAIAAVKSNAPDGVFIEGDDKKLVERLLNVRDTSVGGTMVITIHTDSNISEQRDNGEWSMGSEITSDAWATLRDKLIKHKGQREMFHFGRAEEAVFVRGKPLGKGTSGDVYEYEDPVTNAKVAVKEILAGGFSDADALTREINIMRQFDHRNIVRYIKAQLKNKLLLIFMEKCDTSLESDILSDKKKGGYILDGTQLYASQQLLNAGPQWIAQTVSVLRERVEQLLSGVFFLHNNGIVHRDIKPANVLIKSNVLKISDFGSASNFLAGGDTTVGGLKGTLIYMAPEMHNGKAKERRDSCDIWSLGLTILEMIQATPVEISQCKSLPDFATLYAPTAEGGIALGPDGVPAFTFPPLYSIMRHLPVGPSRDRDREKDKRRMTLIEQNSELYRAVVSFEAELKESEEMIMDLCRKCLKYSNLERINALGLLAHPFLKQDMGLSVQSPSMPIVPMPTGGSEGSFDPSSFQAVNFVRSLDPDVDPLFAGKAKRSGDDDSSGFGGGGGDGDGFSVDSGGSWD